MVGHPLPEHTGSRLSAILFTPSYRQECKPIPEVQLTRAASALYLIDEHHQDATDQ